MVFDEDFVIAPKHVFVPLSRWYSCNAVIKRTVHVSKTFDTIMRNQKVSDIRTSKQFFGGLMMSP